MEPWLTGLGVAIQRGPQSVSLIVATQHKREVAEKIWAANLDVISITPLRSSLEDVYMQIVGGAGTPSDVATRPAGLPS